MGLYYVNETTSPGQGQGDITREGFREYVRTWQVIVDGFGVDLLDGSDLNVRPGPDTILQLPGIAARGEPFISTSGQVDIGSLCQSVSARRGKAPWIWEVESRYSSDLSSFKVDVPLLRPTEIDYGTVREQKPLAKNNLGGPIINSAQEKFDPVPDILVPHLSLTMTRNEAEFDRAIISTHVGTVNDDDWYDFAPGEVLCMDIKAKRKIEGQWVYWEVTYSFEAREFEGADAWAFPILDEGYNWLDKSVNPPKPRPIRIENQPATSPQPLDGKGQVAVKGPGYKPTFLVYYGYPNALFAQLNLP